MFDTKYNEPADYGQYKNWVKTLSKRVNAIVAFLELGRSRAGRDRLS